MGSFYQYDTRGASASDQIMTLERLLENAESEASELARRTESALVAVQALAAERDALRGLLARMIDMAEFWINRDKRPQMSEQEWKTWHACGHGSTWLDAKAALAKGEGC